MDHRVAVGADDSEVFQCSFSSFLPGVRQWSAVMDLGIPVAEIAISGEEIEPTPGHFTYQTATVRAERLLDLRFTQFAFATAMDEE